MSKELTRYECQNKACPLGSRVTPGIFTDGMTAEHWAILTGEPLEAIIDKTAIDPVTNKPYPYGDGICPNCGTEGKALDDPHLVEKGHDPLQPLHDKIAARVADEKDELGARYPEGHELEGKMIDPGAVQAALEELAAKKPTAAAAATSTSEGSKP